MSRTTDYVLGHSDFEIERLQIQAAALADITRRLIRECNIQPGMRVLDIGCGAGDVSMLLAEAVGPSGLVVAIDREARAIETTRSRAEAAGHRNIEAVVATDDDIPVARPFDAALGRNVLPSSARSGSHDQEGGLSGPTWRRRRFPRVRCSISQTVSEHFRASLSMIKSPRP